MADKERTILFHKKVLNTDTVLSNGRIFPKAVLEKALMESENKGMANSLGLPCYKDIETAAQRLDFDQAIGWANNFRFEADGVYADLSIDSECLEHFESCNFCNFSLCGPGTIKEPNEKGESVVSEYHIESVYIEPGKEE